MADFKLMNNDPIEAYFELAERRPHLFAQSERVPLIMDKEKMRAFSEEKAVFYLNRRLEMKKWPCYNIFTVIKMEEL